MSSRASNKYTTITTATTTTNQLTMSTDTKLAMTRTTRITATTTRKAKTTTTTTAATAAVLTNMQKATEFLAFIILIILTTTTTKTNCDIIINTNTNSNHKLNIYPNTKLNSNANANANANSTSATNTNSNNNNNSSNINQPSHNRQLMTITPAIARSPGRECGSIDIRNDCRNFRLLENCTVINGFLVIVVVKDPTNSCNYEQMSFPLLLEVTDFVIFYEVRGIKSIRNLFPNLTVIRGQRLFLNYALGVTNMPQLEMLEFKSLIAIQRGHVFVGTNPMLCSMQKIYWDRLTLTHGVNHIFPVPNDNCPKPPQCLGCDTDYCWTDRVCQKFENANLIDAHAGISHCHEECLGGCLNSTNLGCRVCKGLTDHGACVSACPADKYLLEHFKRCYTAEECLNLGRHLYQGKCILNCAHYGLQVEKSTGRCIECPKNETCTRICESRGNTEITVYSLESVDMLIGCEVINASLIIMIRSPVNENDLKKNLGSIREIRGYLKIVRSLHLSSLSFLENLEKIHGDPLESKTYSLIIYDNPNLKDLWVPKNLELAAGGMYIHLNNKLCNRKLKEFSRTVTHHMGLDSIQISDKEVLCMPQKLTLSVEVLSHRQFKFSWLKSQTSDEVELLYHKMPHDMLKFDEQSEFDSDVCNRVDWQRDLLPRATLNANDTHYTYTIDDLASDTKYACFLKTFGQNESMDARSDVIYATTHVDIPQPPVLQVLSKSETSLNITVRPNSNGGNQWVHYYEVSLYEFPDNLALIDERDYCIEPSFMPEDMPLEAYAQTNLNEDYADCCARMADEVDDQLFVAQIHNEFSCSLDKQENCLPKTKPSYKAPLYTKRLQPYATVTFDNLVRFRLYGIDAKACNAAGCSTTTMHHERTNHSNTADLLYDLSACRVADSTEYHIRFSEPQAPNGAVVSYVIHYRQYVPSANAYESHINCITRFQHEQADYMYVAHLNSSFNEVAVRVHSLASDRLTDWVPVNVCQSAIDRINSITSFVQHQSTSYSLNIFLIFFLIGAGSTLLWICYKRRLWRKLLELRRFMPDQCRWLSLLKRQEETNDDRQILVDDFEIVRFQNNADS